MEGGGWRHKTGSAEWREPVESRARGGELLVIEIGDGFAHGALIEHGFLVDEPGHQCGGAELVDAAR